MHLHYYDKKLSAPNPGYNTLMDVILMYLAIRYFQKQNFYLKENIMLYPNYHDKPVLFSHSHFLNFFFALAWPYLKRADKAIFWERTE